MSDCMIDLETLSILPDATILTIGAIKFDRIDNIKTLENSNTFYRRVNINEFEKNKFSICDDTINWWNNQDPVIKKEAFEGTRVSLDEALKDFSNWYKGCKYIWGNGDDFDCVILSSAYRILNLQQPWNFWETRDLRTLLDISNIKKTNISNNKKHHALYDAYYQIIDAQNAFHKIEIYNDI